MANSSPLTLQIVGDPDPSDYSVSLHRANYTPGNGAGITLDGNGRQYEVFCGYVEQPNGTKIGFLLTPGLSDMKINVPFAGVGIYAVTKLHINSAGELEGYFNLNDGAPDPTSNKPTQAWHKAVIKGHPSYPLTPMGGSTPPPPPPTGGDTFALKPNAKSLTVNY